jgi:hypothetical protein
MSTDHIWSAFFICLAGFVIGIFAGEALFDSQWKCTQWTSAKREIPAHCTMYSIDGSGACISWQEKETVVDEICIEKSRIKNE